MDFGKRNKNKREKNEWDKKKRLGSKGGTKATNSKKKTRKKTVFQLLIKNKL